MGDDRQTATSAPDEVAAARRRRCVGWAIVLLAFVTDALALGSRCFQSVTMMGWETEFNATRSDISLARGVQLAFQGVATPVSGYVVDVFGSRPALCCGILWLAACLVATAHVQSMLALHLVFGVFQGCGYGQCALCFVLCCKNV